MHRTLYEEDEDLGEWNSGGNGSRENRTSETWLEMLAEIRAHTHTHLSLIHI